MSTGNPNLKNILSSFDLDNIIDCPTYHKFINPDFVDLTLTSKKKDVIKSFTFDTGLSGHHNWRITAWESTNKKVTVKEI